MAEVIVIAPSAQFVAVTASDSTLLSYNGVVSRTKALYIGGAGDLAVKNDLDTTVTFQNIPAGTLMPIAVSQVLAATTCTSVIACF
jgi:hypothetical protein